jgi:PAS domain S-box-containing protein
LHAEDTISAHATLPDLRRIEMFRLAADSSPVFMWVSDRSGQLIFANRRYKEFFDVETDDLLGEGWRRIVHPDDVDDFHAAFREALEQRAVFHRQVRVIHPLFGVRWLSCHGEPYPDEAGIFQGYVGLNFDVTDAVEAAAAVRDREDRLRLALAAGRLGDWSWDARTDLATFSELGAAIFGLSEPHITWTRLQERLHPLDAPRAARAVEEAIANRSDYAIEYRVNHPTKGEIWVAARGRPQCGEDGACTGMVGVVRDITEEKQSEQTLRESELRQRLINQATPECIKIVAKDGRLLHMNEAGLQMIEAPDFKSVLEADTFTLIAPEHRSDWRTKHLKVISGEPASWEFDIIGLAGTRRRMETHAVPLRLPDGQIAQLAVTRDVTDRKRTEALLAAQAQRLAILNETGAAIAAELDIGRLVQLVTDAGVKLTGAKFGAFFYNVTGDEGEELQLYTLSGADRSDFELFGHPRPTAVFAPTFRGEGIVRSDDITRDPRYGLSSPHFGMPEKHLPVRSYLAVPVRSRTGDVIGGLFFGHPDPGVFTDAAEQLMLGLAGQAGTALDNARLFDAAQRANQELEKRVEARTRELTAASEALRQSQKMEAIGQLTGGIAHDFNNLLTVIRGSADVLQTREMPEDRRIRYLQAISETADRAARLTSQLLAFARRQTLSPEVFDVVQRVQSVSEMLQSVLGSRIQVRVEVSGTDHWVEADPIQFETALVNLAINARDAMVGEGVLTIAIRRGPAPSGSESVSLSVSDTGHGIPADLHERIFEPFFTTKEVGKGTGLGLSQVYGFVKQSDGDISVTSAPREGTTFSLSLPLVPPPKATRGNAIETPRQPAPGTRILVVEDNADVRFFTTQLLRDLGFVTGEAIDAQEAISILQERQGDYDVVFSDVVMPGMNGLELGRVIRQRWPRLPVILTSGYSTAIIEEAKHGFVLLPKPYAPEDVSRVLADVLARRSL